MPMMAGQDSTGRIARHASRMRCAVSALAIAGSVLLAGAAPALAQSPHACVRLHQSPVPSIEGLEGMFFRIDPDLLMDTRLPETMIDDIARLSEVLAARGTKLVFVPVPTKALAMPDQLGPEASRYGYNPRLARALYADTIAILRSKGITTVDAVQAFAGYSQEQPVFFRTDPRLSNEGLRRLARATADELGPEYLGSMAFSLVEETEVILESHQRFGMQLSCQGTLPEVRARTARLASNGGTPTDDQTIAVVGSDLAGGPDREFGSFLARYLRRRVDHDVRSEDAHAALAAYLTSDRFRLEPPNLLIWHVPIWQNPAAFGDQPFRELIAAASDACQPLSGLLLSDDGTLSVDLSGIDQGTGRSLRFDGGDATVTEATFRFTSPNGTERTRRVIRKDPEIATPRIYMPLSGLWPEGANQLAVTAEAQGEMTPRISVCNG